MTSLSWITEESALRVFDVISFREYAVAGCRWALMELASFPILKRPILRRDFITRMEVFRGFAGMGAAAYHGMPISMESPDGK